MYFMGRRKASIQSSPRAKLFNYSAQIVIANPYSVETIFEGVQLLTERSSLIYSPNGLDFHYPAEVDYEADLEQALPEIELIKGCIPILITHHA